MDRGRERKRIRKMSFNKLNKCKIGLNKSIYYIKELVTGRNGNGSNNDIRDILIFYY